MLLHVTGFTGRSQRAVTAVKAYAILAPYLNRASIYGSLLFFCIEFNPPKKRILAHSEVSVFVSLWKAVGWGGDVRVRHQGHMSNSREESVAITQGNLMPKQHLAMTGQHVALLS